MYKKESIGRKGQITIFIIIAIIIVAVVLILSFSSLKNLFTPVPVSEFFPRSCIENSVKDSLNETFLHGGTLNPELYFRYDNLSLAYLCYTQEWYKTCNMQYPFLKQTIEQELMTDSQAEIEKCINDRINSFKDRGYEVVFNGVKKAEIAIEPNRIVVSFNASISLSKGEESLILDSQRMETIFNSKAYEIIMVASSIQNYEARFGDAIIDAYMAFYPNLKVEKYKQSDGTKVFIITDRNSGEKLQFATRSLAWPPGFAFQ